MRSGLCILVPPAQEHPPQWWRLEDGAVVESGSGVWPENAGKQVAFLLPPSLVALHMVDLPADMPPDQARGAARLLATEASIAASEAMHGAGAGSPDTGYRGYAIAGQDMMRVLAWARLHGLDPDIVIPVAEVIEQPEAGFAVLDGGEGQGIVRGEGLCFAADEAFAADLMAGRALAAVPVTSFLVSLAEKLADPPCNLRSGRFAHARRWHVAPARLVRLAVGVGLVALATLLIGLVTITRLHADAARLEEKSLALARPVVGALPEGAATRVALDARLAQAGRSAGLSGMLAALVGAMRAVPDATLLNLSRESDGVTRLRLIAPQAAAFDSIAQGLRANGYDVSATPFASPTGGIGMELAVRP